MAAATATSPLKKRKAQGRGRSNSLPCHVVDYLKKWLMSPEHINHPYPSESEKARMVADTGIEIKRLNNWFVNNRIRFWKPRFEAMQKELEEQKKRKLSDSLVSPEMTSMPPPPPKVTPRRSSSPKQVLSRNIPQVIDPTSKLLAPSLEVTYLMRTTSTASATVSDDSDSDNDVPAFSRNSSDRRARKRQRTEVGGENLMINANVFEPISRFNSNDVEQWKLACSSSFSSCPKLDDTNLPSLDEAVRLFGYSGVTSR